MQWLIKDIRLIGYTYGKNVGSARKTLIFRSSLKPCLLFFRLTGRFERDHFPL